MNHARISYLLGFFLFRISLVITIFFSKASPVLATIKVNNSNLITQVKIQGNHKVETAAILGIIATKPGATLKAQVVRKDILALYNLGYFSDIRFYKEQTNNNSLEIIIKVKEKPAITAIKFLGLSEFKEADLKGELETKLFTIVDEGKIQADVRLIEKKYADKGYFLAKVSYKLNTTGDNSVTLIFTISEHAQIMVGSVFLIGNKYFSDNDLISKMASQPYTRTTAFGSSSLYQAHMVNRDVEFLSFYYRDHGFADIKVQKPYVVMDADKKFVRITFNIEEGTQYSLGTIKVSGDIGEQFYTQKELLPLMKLKPKNLFKYSYFARDIEKLVDKYGDLGYAYVDVNPLTTFDKENGIVNIEYHITKGQQVYFGNIKITGNVKTRDNVIRREFKIYDSALYSGTKMTKSLNNVRRLGFFESVQVIKKRAQDHNNLLDLEFRVKEKPTGQLQASVGYSPGGETKSKFFGQGRYDEKNQSGKGWTSSLTAKWSNEKDYQLDIGFTDPRVNDSQWTLGLGVSYQIQLTQYPSGNEVPEKRTSTSFSIGRKVIELIHATLSVRHRRIIAQEKVISLDNLQVDGIENSVSIILTRRKLDNYLDPTSGSSLSLSHQFTGGPFGGNYQFMESKIDTSYYIPLDFGENIRSYFKLHGVLGVLWRFQNEDIPTNERYRLGGFYDLRGYSDYSVSPYARRGRSPVSSYYHYPTGGNKEVYFQLEYFFPLIAQAGIKSLFFIDTGRVYNENEAIQLKDFLVDMGFGFRWITPIAPFRFEWAYPLNYATRSFKEPKFIFTIGY